MTYWELGFVYHLSRQNCLWDNADGQFKKGEGINDLQGPVESRIISILEKGLVIGRCKGWGTRAGTNLYNYPTRASYTPYQ